MSEAYESVNIAQAREMLKTHSVTVVDIRDSASYDEAHIEGALLLNRDNVRDFIQKTDKSRKVLCYCYHGISSRDAASLLTRNGFQKVYNLEGGFEAWRNAK